LGRPLVSTICIIDDLETITRVASWLQVSGWCPCESTRVGDLLGEGVKGDDVGGWALIEDNGDCARGCWAPGDCVGGASWYDLVQAWLSDGIAGIGTLCSRSGVSTGESSEGSRKKSEFEHLDV